MSFRSKALREQRAPLAKEIRTLADAVNNTPDGKPREFTAEEKAKWDAINADYNRLTASIEIEERAEQVDATLAERRELKRLRRSAPGSDGSGQINDKHRALALAAWVRGGDGMDEEAEEACRITGMRPRSKSLTLSLLPTSAHRDLRERFRSVHPSRARREVQDFRADLGTVPGSGAGYFVPPETLIRELEVNMLYYGGMRQVSDEIRTATGERISWPTADDTTNTGVQLEQAGSIGSSVDPTAGKVYWDAYKFSSKPVLVNYELLEDSVFNLPEVIGNLLGIRLGRITNTRFTTGTGANQPKGIITAATTFSAASATAITFDDIIGLEHSVDPAYRVIDPGFMLHDTMVSNIRKLKDGTGRYLWESNQQVGRPDSLHGYPVTINQDMDSTMSSGKKTVLFGSLCHYKIRTVGSIRLYRLQERYRDTDQDAFVAFLREDGNLLTAGTAPVKVLAH